MAKTAAVLLGVIPAFVLLSSIFSNTSSDTAFAKEMFVRLGIFAALYAAFRVACRLSIPRLSWGLGVLAVYVPTLFLLAFFIFAYLNSLAVGDVDFGQAQHRAKDLLLIGFFTGTLIAACLGTYAGVWARQHFSSKE